MQIQLLIFIILSATLNFSCDGDKLEDKKASVASVKKNSLKPLSLFWEKACESDVLMHSFDCSKMDCYQIELFQDPFKDLVVITLDLRDSLSDIIYCSRFRYGSRSKKSIQESKANALILANSSIGDTITFLYEMPLKLVVKPKNQNINTFFSETIWTLSPVDEDSDWLDPEVWMVKGRSGEREIVIKRHTFKDSVYYNNLQRVLNICKVKDYKYE
ncbi:MAG: hypothetical protein IT261_01160 [Saprospiraceae bacterium]|nr:hypothetical protein [Saprospiraceae bacterium]